MILTARRHRRHRPGLSGLVNPFFSKYWFPGPEACAAIRSVDDAWLLAAGKKARLAHESWRRNKKHALSRDRHLYADTRPV